MSRLRSVLGQIPGLKQLYRVFVPAPPFSSADYWEERYRIGSNSGAGSYGRLARFKAEVLNGWIRDKQIDSVVEFGCGDGNQLTLLNAPRYIGVDVSQTVLDKCKARFATDATKSFQLFDPDRTYEAEAAMSLDVIYHLVEDEAFGAYMRCLCSSGRKYPTIYSSNDERPSPVDHVRHRRFTDWIAKHAPEWKPAGRLENRFPFDRSNPDETSFADFYFFEKR